jgi:cytochrome c peroxidase
MGGLTGGASVGPGVGYDPGPTLLLILRWPLALPLEDTALSAHLGQFASQLVGLSPTQLNEQITSDPKVASLGRFAVTLDPGDIGLFRTPSLRNVARTAPYFHDGRAADLTEAVDREIYYRGNERPLVLNPAERADLVSFLESLTSPEPVENAR